MLAFRVEFCASVINHDKWVRHIGPYAGSEYAYGETKKWQKENGFNMDPSICYDEKLHPVPEYDYRLIRALNKNHRTYYDTDNLYGFESVNFMAAWFDEDTRIELHSNGYRCMVYETDKLFCGKRQAIFSRKNCTLVGMVDILTLERII